jgi:hypothetical protein
MKYMHKRHRLGIFEEAVGTLSEIAQEDGFLNAEISGFVIVLPFEIEAKLAPLVGERVGILHTDIPGKECLVRTIVEESSLAFDKIDMVGLITLKAQQEKARA